MLTHQNPVATEPERVVVLGACGFVGTHLTSHLTSQQIPVLPMPLANGDLTNPEMISTLARIIRPEDSLVMLAALTPDRGNGIPTLMRNLEMARTVCSALQASPCKHVVYFSSDAVYPYQSSLISEDSCAQVRDLYGCMHRTREVMFTNSVKAPVAIVRATLIFGPGDTHNAYGPNRMLRSATSEGRIGLFGEGEETRDHIWIDDVVTLTTRILTHRSSGTLNAATGQSIPYRQLAELIASQFDRDVEIISKPRQQPITHRRFDVTACRQAFPSFRFTPLAEGITAVHRRMIERAQPRHVR